MLDLFTLQETPITDIETSRLGELEATIEGGLKTFVDVGMALMEIRDSRLYISEYQTFEDYCKERWGMVRRRAYQMIEAALVVDNVQNFAQILPANDAQARPLASLSPDLQAQAWQQAIDTAPEGKITAAHVQSVVDEFRQSGEKRPVSYHVSDDSYEWYTPQEYTTAAAGVMGSIDLDPASSELANKTVGAGRYYTKDDDGLTQPWFGNVWLNPPYNMPAIEQFIDRVVNAYESGEIKQAIILTNNSTDTGWFHKLIDYPICFTKGRVQFVNGDERLATRQGQAIFYLGKNVDLFAKVFGVFGAVLVRYDNSEPG